MVLIILIAIAMLEHDYFSTTICMTLLVLLSCSEVGSKVTAFQSHLVVAWMCTPRLRNSLCTNPEKQEVINSYENNVECPSIRNYHAENNGSNVSVYYSQTEYTASQCCF